MTTLDSALLSVDLLNNPASPCGKDTDGKFLSNGRYSAAKPIGVLFIVGCMGFAWSQSLTPPTTVTLPSPSIEGLTDAGVSAHTYVQTLASPRNFRPAPRESGSTPFFTIRRGWL